MESSSVLTGWIASGDGRDTAQCGALLRGSVAYLIKKAECKKRKIAF